MQPGTVVEATAGRDSGRFLAVLSVEEPFAYIADGRTRRIEKPKKKKLIHLAGTACQLKADELETNKKLRRALAEFNGGNGKETL